MVLGDSEYLNNINKVIEMGIKHISQVMTNKNLKIFIKYSGTVFPLYLRKILTNTIMTCIANAVMAMMVKREIWPMLTKMLSIDA